MHVLIELSFRSLVIFVCFLFPVTGFFIARHKLRLAAARDQEIKRLQALAAEEACRAEFEVASGSLNYDVVVSTPPPPPPPEKESYCAVCYSPTTTRCARCKAVRYCSGKCQIVHWRQGHKENCHPAPVVDPYGKSDEGQKVTKTNLKPDAEKLKARQSTEKYSREPEVPKPGPPPGVPCVKVDETEDDDLANRKETNSPTGSAATSFSGFSTSTGASGSSDDVSFSESVGSFDLGRAYTHQSVNDSLDIRQNSFNLEQIDQSRPLSPKFASLVDSVNGFAKFSKSNKVKTCCNNGENELELNSSTDVLNDRRKSPATKACTSSSDFWGRTIDSFESESDDESISCVSSKTKISPSGSCPHISLNVNARKTTSKTVSSSYGLKSFSSQTVSTKDALHSGKVILPSSERSSHIARDRSRTLNCRAADGQSASVSDATLVSGGRGSSGLSVKSGNGHSVDASDIVSSQGTRSSNEKTGSKTSVVKVFDQLRGPKASEHYPTEVELILYDVFVKLYNWNKVELHPSGLINCGNSCYANAVLQCLTFTPPLTAYLLQGLHSKSCGKKEWCFMCEFEILILKAKEGKSPPSPIGILSQLRNTGSHLGNGKEEDAHEFLRYAIDTMQSVCLMESFGLNASQSLKEETTLIGLTFGGYLRSRIRCLRCQGKSERQERMMDLNVEIEGDIATLEEALRRFTGTEVLDGENKYHCSRCKSYEKAKKKLTILEAPNVLTIALKRFQCGKYGKINKSIRFPEILDLAPYMSGTSDKSPIYKLYGVVVHLGVRNTSFTGHYVCYVKNMQNKWFKVDDSTVTIVELDNVLEKGAYMLLYSRCSARAPRILRSRIISSDSKHRAIPSWISAKGNNTKLKSFSSHPSGPPQEISTSPLQRVSDEDSSSDNSSLLSSRSDEGSSSTDSTQYSTSTDGLPDYLHWRNYGDSDNSSSSSSPLGLKHLPLSDSNRYASSGIESVGFWDSQPFEDSSRFAYSDGKESGLVLNSEIGNYQGSDAERLGRESVSNVKLRTSNRERTRGV